MIVIKPNIPKTEPCTEDIDSDFYKYSHAYRVKGMHDYTLCGVGSEEFDYTKYKKVKIITCPDCLEIIKDCKSYKL